MNIGTLEQVRDEMNRGLYNMTDICSEPNGALKHKELLHGIRKPVNVRETFYGKD